MLDSYSPLSSFFFSPWLKFCFVFWFTSFNFFRNFHKNYQKNYFEIFYLSSNNAKNNNEIKNGRTPGEIHGFPIKRLEMTRNYSRMWGAKHLEAILVCHTLSVTPPLKLTLLYSIMYWNLRHFKPKQPPYQSKEPVYCNKTKEKTRTENMH